MKILLAALTIILGFSSLAQAHGGHGNISNNSEISAIQAVDSAAQGMMTTAINHDLCCHSSPSCLPTGGLNPSGQYERIQFGRAVTYHDNRAPQRQGLAWQPVTPPPILLV